MKKEIERKFLVNHSLLPSNMKGHSYTQSYLSINDNGIIRIRKEGDVSKLTIKTKNVGISRSEFEYNIPTDDYKEIAKLSISETVKKTRYKVTYKNKIWEVDEFHEKNKGLWIAEIELQNENESFKKPGWLLEEITYDYRYMNANLSKHPYSQW